MEDSALEVAGTVGMTNAHEQVTEVVSSELWKD